jgi:hypothetical protein
MGKYLFILINLIGYVYYSYIQGDDVVITVEAPTEVVAGTDFTVRVTIAKTKDIERFARFYQELPIGLTAEEDETQNAIFSFKNQQAKFIWMPGALPEVDTFSITYKVHVDITLSGKIVIPGQFVYIKNNERAEIKVDPIEVTILNTSAVGDSNLVSENMEKSSTTVTTASGTTTNTLNTKRAIEITGNEAKVSIVLYKKGVNNTFAKVEEKIPDGMEAVSVDNAGALFTFDNQTAKYLWENLPEGDSLIVSYKLKKKDGSAVTNQDLAFVGQFSYLDGNKTINREIKPDKKYQAPLVADNTKTTTAEQDNVTQSENNKEVDTQQEQQAQVTSTVSYKVQICALKEKRRSVRYLQKVCHLNEAISLEDNEGWKKYTIGNFLVYKEARDRRVSLWKTTPVKDAFVSAYNNGNRITVQEALMIANQKWIQ